MGVLRPWEEGLLTSVINNIVIYFNLRRVVQDDLEALECAFLRIGNTRSLGNLNIHHGIIILFQEPAELAETWCWVAADANHLMHNVSQAHGMQEVR